MHSFNLMVCLFVIDYFLPKGETTWSFEFCFCLSKNSLNGSLPCWIGNAGELSDWAVGLVLTAFWSRNFLNGSWPEGAVWTSAVGSDLVCCWGCGISGLNLTSVLLLSPLKIEKSPIAAAITAKSTTRFLMCNRHRHLALLMRRKWLKRQKQWRTFLACRKIPDLLVDNINIYATLHKL